MLRLFCALAIAAPCIAYSQSQVTVSGGFVAGYRFTPSKSDGTASKHAIDNLEAAGSNLTFRGVEDLGSGLKANFILNHRFDPSTGSQTGSSFFTNSKIGISGGFGEISVGKMWGPVDELLRRPLDVYMPLGLGTTVYGGPFDAPTRYNGTLMYMSPEIGGVRVSGAVVSKNNMASKQQNTTELAALYRSGPLVLGLGYTLNAGNTASAVDNFKDRDVLTIGGRYDFSKLQLGLTYSRVAAPGQAQDSDRYSLGARYPLSNALALKFGYEFLEVADRDKSRTFALGAEYRVSKRTMFFSEVGRTQSDIRAKDDKGVTFMLGMAHRF